MSSQPLTRWTRYEDLPEFLTPAECRAYLNISRNGIYDLLRRGAIPHRRFGRIIRIPKTALCENSRHGDEGGYQR